MRRGFWRRVMMTGAAMAGLALAGAAPAHAAASLLLPDGRVLSVWEVRIQPRSLNDQDGSSSLAYSISAPGGATAGTIRGVVSGTEDAARDAQPRLALDPVSGDAVALWSRFDGVYSKIAYARLEGSAWLDLRFLTFGGGDDTDPRIVVGRDGAYLFWVAQGARYLFIPVDLSAGHPLGSPHEIKLGSPSGSPSTQASTDIPIVIDHNGGKQSRNRLLLWSPKDRASVSGNQDVPINLGQNHLKDSVWGSGSSPQCRSAVIVVPNPAVTLLRVFSFTNGAAREIAKVRLPASIPDGFADQTAASYLNANCD